MSTSDKKPLPEDVVGTTGHSWDGIEELNNPLPRWWLWSFYACIAFALIYAVLYPAIPLKSGATPGLLGYSTRAEVAREIERFQGANADLVARLIEVELDPEVIRADPDLYNYAVQGGAAVFRTFCAQCHGSGAAGVQAAGYPSLLDDDWLWGGALEDIYTTVTHGIRNEDDPDARWSQMPAFGVDELLTDEEIGQVVHYVRKISGQEHDAALASDGEEVFLYNCASCHMDDGTGDRYQGAPNLTDAIWLYGGSVETLTETVFYARFGVMPSHQERLSEADRRAVATYVHQLGGGE
ncbi:cytochrome-c oxidase, cbb3-type subunit III [Rhodovulum tesquicola]|uniref:cytochrome-c oxidase, cbb3-type subunit III n=1 Tax=Rhodovulum tesquicola TaxID=540254 RepID=UPI002098056E|nr:cytochrome-c oxidase, cbb3-type subunit III [Rhodovulum tesquicola]MCO8145105.1 cytochrome-c oxidase, cbb3-type subunit III [Rhodovulum tesquicola]